MELKDVNELIDKGFSPDQIVELAKSTQTLAEPEAQIDTKTPAPVDEVAELKRTVASLQDTIKAIQTSNLKGAEISSADMSQRESASDILAQVFYGNKGGK